MGRPQLCWKALADRRGQEVWQNYKHKPSQAQTTGTGLSLGLQRGHRTSQCFIGRWSQNKRSCELPFSCTQLVGSLLPLPPVSHSILPPLFMPGWLVLTWPEALFGLAVASLQRGRGRQGRGDIHARPECPAEQNPASPDKPCLLLLQKPSQPRGSGRTLR